MLGEERRSAAKGARHFKDLKLAHLLELRIKGREGERWNLPPSSRSAVPPAAFPDVAACQLAFIRFATSEPSLLLKLKTPLGRPPERMRRPA
jgi:hypothetical protein